MRLENVVALIHGKLVNTPFVHTFTNIVFEAKNVKRGDLFIAYDENEIEDAIFNGAYGIIFDKPTQISDTEIAWIKVQNLDDALTRLLRFKLIAKNLTVYTCNEIILHFALQITTDNSLVILDGDIKYLYNSLRNLEENTLVLFCPNRTTSDIFTHTKPLLENKGLKIKIVEQTLFETSFIYKNIFYERQLLSPLFIPYLEQLFYFFTTYKINFRVKKLTLTNHFEAIFINKKFTIQEFGTTDMVIIFEQESSLVASEMEFLQHYASWAKLLFIVPQNIVSSLDTKLLSSGNFQTYKEEKEIHKLLNTYDFHFALVMATHKSFLQEHNEVQKNLTLFDF